MNEKTTNVFDLISDQELKSLKCPSINEELDKWKLNNQFINEQTVGMLLKQIDANLRFISLRHFGESQGCINQIYVITVSRRNQAEITDADYHNNLEQEELFLKISNPDERFKGKKSCEASVIDYIRKNTTIPVPTILSYSTDAQKSPIKCEYILMEKAKGCQLSKVIPSTANETPKSLIHEMIGYIRQIKYLNVFADADPRREATTSVFCCLGENLQPIPIYPVNTLHSNFLDLWNEMIVCHIEEIKKIKIFSKVADILDEKRLKVMRLSNDPSCSVNKPFLAHSDLNDTNIFVEPESFRITCIIDWEWSVHSIWSDLDFPLEWLDENNPTEQKQLLTITNEILKQDYPDLYQQRSSQTAEFYRYLYELYFSASSCCNFSYFWSNCEKKVDCVEEKIRWSMINNVHALEEKLVEFEDKFATLNEKN
jgi:hypothetical protein